MTDPITPEIREAAGLAVCKLRTTTTCSKVCRECAPVVDAALAAAVPLIRAEVVRECAATIRARRQELADLYAIIEHTEMRKIIVAKISVLDESLKGVRALAEQKDTPA